MGRREENIFVAPNAVDTELFAEEGAEAREESEKQPRGVEVAGTFFSVCGPARAAKKECLTCLRPMAN